MLETRREQAEVESSTLDLISSVTARQHSTTASIGGDVARMQQEVQTIEARNQARRSMTPAAEAPYGRLTQAWNRLVYPEILSRPAGRSGLRRRKRKSRGQEEDAGKRDQATSDTPRPRRPKWSLPSDRKRTSRPRRSDRLPQPK